MKRFFVSFYIIIGLIFSSSPGLTQSSLVFLNVISKDQKESYKAVLEAECELVRTEWAEDWDSSSLNYVLFTLPLYERIFSELPPIYGSCRTSDQGGVPGTLMEKSEKRYNGWLGIEISWLIPESTLHDLANYVHNYTYEKLNRTKYNLWNNFWNLHFKQIAKPLSCQDVVLKFIADYQVEIEEGEAQESIFQIDVRAHSKIYSKIGLKQTTILEDSRESFDKPFYPWTLLREDERLIVDKGFEPQAEFLWESDEITYKTNPVILKHFSYLQILIYPLYQTLIFKNSDNRYDINLENYELDQTNTPVDRNILACNY